MLFDGDYDGLGHGFAGSFGESPSEPEQFAMKLRLIAALRKD